MKAYHNLRFGRLSSPWTVFQWTKIQNWKLITTCRYTNTPCRSLYFNELRYKIESLSQPANIIWYRFFTVFQWTKIQNWKLITTLEKTDWCKGKLYFNELRYKIESLSQLATNTTHCDDTVFQWTKIQNWKLITTFIAIQFIKFILYFNELRYKIESLSQQIRMRSRSRINCISMN